MDEISNTNSIAENGSTVPVLQSATGLKMPLEPTAALEAKTDIMSTTI